MADFERLFMGAPNEERFGFCQGMRVGETIYVSGQVGKDNATGAMVGEEPTLETRYQRTIANIRTIIGELAEGPTRIASMHVHQTRWEPEDYETVAEQQRALVGAEAPAVCVAPVQGLADPKYLVEVSAVATEGEVVRVEDESTWNLAVGGSAATQVGETIYLGGHLPLGEGGAVVGDSVGEQLDHAIAGMKATLAELDATLASCVSVQLWIAEGASPDVFAEVAAVNSRHFGAAKPTSTLVFAPSLPLGALAQVAGIAITSMPVDPHPGNDREESK